MMKNKKILSYAVMASLLCSIYGGVAYAGVITADGTITNDTNQSSQHGDHYGEINVANGVGSVDGDVHLLMGVGEFDLINPKDPVVLYTTDNVVLNITQDASKYAEINKLLAFTNITGLYGSHVYMDKNGLEPSTLKMNIKAISGNSITNDPGTFIASASSDIKVMYGSLLKANIYNTVEGNLDVTAVAQAGTCKQPVNNNNAYGSIIGMQADGFKNTINGNAKMDFTALGGKAFQTNSNAVGNIIALYTNTGGSNIINGNAQIIGTAQGGSAEGRSSDAHADATGLFSRYSRENIVASNNKITGDLNLKLTASAGTATEELQVGNEAFESTANAQVYGLDVTNLTIYDSSQVASPQVGAPSTITITNRVDGNVTMDLLAQGGTSKGTLVSLVADGEAAGMHGYTSPTFGTSQAFNSIGGNFTANVKAVGGELLAASTNTSRASVQATAYGMQADRKALNLVEGNGNFNIIALGGTHNVVNPGNNVAQAKAYGLYAVNGGKNLIKGDVTIKTDATVQQTTGINNFASYALYADGFQIDEGTPQNDLSAATKKVIYGDIFSNFGENLLNLATPDSFLQGNLLTINGTNKITIGRGATWRPVFDNRYGSFFSIGDPATYRKDYAVTSVTTNNGDIINLQQDGVIDLTWDTPQAGRNTGDRTLNLATLNTQGGVFKVNTDIVKGNSDKINLTGAASGNSAKVQINYDPAFATMTLNSSTPAKNGGVTVVSGAGASSLSLGAKDTEYKALKFTPEVVYNGATNSWEITSIKTGSSSNVTTAADSKFVVDDAWYQTVNSLSKRLGDLHKGVEKDNNIWARFQRSNNEAGTGNKAQLNANLFQVGYDKEFSRNNGKTYWGIAVDHLDGRAGYERGHGKVKGTDIAVYNTWLGNSGHYYDVILRRGHFSNNYKITDLSNNYSEADYGMNATTLSGEYGYRKSFAHGSYLEPQAELILAHMEGSDYTSSNGSNIHNDSYNHVITRLGLVAGRKMAQGGFYGKVGYFHDFAGSGDITYDTVNFKGSHAKNWFEVAAGGDVQVAKNCKVYGEVTKYFKDIKNSLNYNVGVRWNF